MVTEKILQILLTAIQTNEAVLRRANANGIRELFMTVKSRKLSNLSYNIRVERYQLIIKGKIEIRRGAGR